MLGPWTKSRWGVRGLILSFWSGPWYESVSRSQTFLIIKLFNIWISSLLIKQKVKQSRGCYFRRSLSWLFRCHHCHLLQGGKDVHTHTTYKAQDGPVKTLQPGWNGRQATLPARLKGLLWKERRWKPRRGTSSEVMLHLVQYSVRGWRVGVLMSRWTRSTVRPLSGAPLNTSLFISKRHFGTLFRKATK